jgi:colicin import membrane protein
MSMRRRSAAAEAADAAAKAAQREQAMQKKQAVEAAEAIKAAKEAAVQQRMAEQGAREARSQVARRDEQLKTTMMLATQNAESLRAKVEELREEKQALMAEKEALVAEKEALTASLGRETVATKTAEAQARMSVQEAASARADVQRAKSALAESRAQQTSEIKEAVRTNMEQIALLKQQLKEANDMIEWADAGRAGALREVDAAKRDLAGARQEADAAKRDRAGARQEADAAKRDRAGARQEADAAKRDLAGARQEADAAKRELVGARQEADAAKRELAGAKASLKEEKEKRVALEKEVHALKAGTGCVSGSPADRIYAEQQADAQRRNLLPPMSTREQSAANANSFGRTLLVQFPSGPILADPTAVILRPATRQFASAVNTIFYNAKKEHWKCTGNSITGLDGDRLLKPIAIYEVVASALNRKYIGEKAEVRVNRCDPREPLVPCATDGIFNGAVTDDLGGGALEPGAPLNEKVLLHATNANNVDKILHSGINEMFSTKGTFFGNGVYMADLVCKSAAYSEVPVPGATIGKLLRLTPEEAGSAKYLLIFRVLLGCPARTSQDMRWLSSFDGVKSEGYQKSPIYAPGSNGGVWNPPFTSLVGQYPGRPREYIIKNAERERALLIGIVAFRDTTVSSERRQNRVSEWA